MMANNSDLMRVLDSNDSITLYKLENDLFDTVVVVYNEDESDEETYMLTDMQGQYPETIDEISDYEWARVEDINW